MNEKEEYLPMYVEWIANELYSWAETWVYGYYPDEETKKESDEAYYFVQGLALKLETDNCSKEDYDNILFHLWQKFHE